MNKLIIVLSLAFVTSGCTVVTSSGVESIANGRYKVSTNMRGIKVNSEDNSSLTSNRAIADAKAFCLARGGRYPRVTKQSVEKSGRATAVVYFKCVK